MHRISSNWTLILKIFLPTAWITFFGLLTLAILLAGPGELPMGGGLVFKLVFTLGFIVFFGFLYFTVLRLKRVDFSDDGIYISNYFKSYRYQYLDVAKIEETNLGLFTLGTLFLHQKGSFGRKIYFLISQIHYQDFLDKHPDRFKHLL
jgi:hypothetical protein